MGDRGAPEGQARVLKSIGMKRRRARRLGQKGEARMADEGKAEALVGRAEGLGLRIEYDSGFLVATRSVSADRQRDDDAAEAIIEQLGKCRREVFSIAVAKARGVRGSNFVGRQVFIPSLQVWGTLTDCTAEGIVTVSYPGHRDPERKLTFSDPGDGVLIIVDERPAPASPNSFAFIADERVRLRCERAEAVGLSLEHDSGFTVAKWRTRVGVELEVCEATVRDLGKSMREVYGYMVARAQGVRGGDFIGQRVFVEPFDAFGILASSDVGGGVAVSYRDKHTGSERTCHCQGDDLMVIAEEPAQAPAEQDSESGWRKLVRRAFRG